ncbi:MAG: hypothetical protein AAF519_00890 [Bacteroidota bacterium]
MTPTTEHIEILKSLQKEIILNPKMKHRIILKAIKTAKTKELSRLIRSYNKKNAL